MGTDDITLNLNHDFYWRLQWKENAAIVKK
jgi:hypothetical protein